ncbi:hypothetical protein CLOSTHATH_00045 [Hungatella hathewayi DSM 13479]|uniref:Uncharacterized protein n=1 Tax=Hungatella hathewayi DSM 13479 TaxID=566550 RepID=D3A8Y2_9FIRM|nr:hypothetical protein CLOSTHATH_00045 [Hungatella hathewayi DSM 13479]
MYSVLKEPKETQIILNKLYVLFIMFSLFSTDYRPPFNHIKA